MARLQRSRSQILRWTHNGCSTQVEVECVRVFMVPTHLHWICATTAYGKRGHHWRHQNIDHRATNCKHGHTCESSGKHFFPVKDCNHFHGIGYVFVCQTVKLTRFCPIRTNPLFHALWCSSQMLLVFSFSTISISKNSLSNA